MIIIQERIISASIKITLFKIYSIQKYGYRCVSLHFLPKYAQKYNNGCNDFYLLIVVHQEPDNLNFHYGIPFRIELANYLRFEQFYKTKQNIGVINTIALIFTIGLTMLYLIIYILGPQYKPRKKFIGKLFVFLCDIYIWLLFFPCMITCFEFCFCNQEQDCNYDALRIILQLLAIFGLICGLLNIIVLTTLLNNNWENKKDCFNGENVIYLSCYQLSRFVLAFFVVFSTKLYTYLWLFMVVSLTLYTLFLVSILFGGGFLAFGTKYTRQLFIIMLIIMISTTFSSIIDELHRSQNSDIVFQQQNQQKENGIL